ncbi:MAG TPA: hypothetical protein VF174_04735 [Micromonosporaceae bacterium]
MAATIPQIMTGLKDRLATVSGLRATDYAPDNPNPPCAFPLVPAILSYREAMRRGTYVIPFRIALLTGAQLDRAGQKALAGYANPTGDQSIRAALEDGDRTLGGLVDDLIVDGFDPDGLQEVGLVAYYGGVFTVRVIASGA